MITVMAALTGRFDTLAHGVMRLFDAGPAGPELEATTEVPEAIEHGVYTFSDLDIHPDVLFRPYTAGPYFSEGVTSASARMIEEFRDLLTLYEQRQGEDDNFTVRVVDNRTNETLEVFVLEQERERYRQQEEERAWNWGRIDGIRRDETRRLVSKWVSRGVPNSAITIKWGRKDQVREARRREHAFIEYEIRLARMLGLSLLATEIGTVETFNDDRLVSSVGARSRYQMMPYVLRQHDIHHYDLTTASGARIPVYEEWHPLITMEASLRTVAGYVNAVGHEIPGLSAYHTGPGNIYHVFRLYLTEKADQVNAASATVMDAYMWAVTEGYPKVSANSSFKTYSRGYVASAYGALRATDDLPIDSTLTLRADRVQIRPGKQIFLSTLLDALGDEGAELDWGPGTEELSLYERFRSLNPHITLPESAGPGAVSPRADVRLVPEVHGAPVRFFLPVGATDLLEKADLNVIDEEKTFRFDRDTFAPPSPAQLTIWDRQYQNLVEDIQRFGFTDENRRRLFFLEDRFEELAEANPSYYRQSQLKVIRIHKEIWQYGVWDKMKSVVEATMGQSRLRTRPPAPLNRTPFQAAAPSGRTLFP